MINTNDLENFKKFLQSGSSKAKVTQIILVSLAVGALPIIVGGALAMGNAVQLFNKNYKRKQINNALAGLRRRKLIEYVSDKNGVTTVRITSKGKTRLKSFSMDLLSIDKQAKWDGKWRVVMFDLPIQYTKVREYLRLKLKQLGFIQLQKSVWVYPYPCTDELLFIADYYKVKNYVDILVVEELVNDEKLRKYFDL